VAVNEVKVGEVSVGIERNGFCVPRSLERWETDRSTKLLEWKLVQERGLPTDVSADFLQ